MAENDAVQAKATPPAGGTGVTPVVPDKASPKAESTPREVEHKDLNREVVETTVFVVFLVLLLKSFVAEAFVIPTGSMATTLLGNHHGVKCDNCGYPFLLNSKDDSDDRPQFNGQAICPNCLSVKKNPPEAVGGDKVLVNKPWYDIVKPNPERNRGDVFVFKYPGNPKNPPNQVWGPQKYYVAHNYIKRVWGFPGEKLAIWYGDIYLRSGAKGQEQLQILHKRPAQYIDMRRIVFHNDYQPEKFAASVLPRWEDHRVRQAERSQPGPTDRQPNDWKPEEAGKVFQVAAADQTSWLRYENLVWPSPEWPNEVRDPAERERLVKQARQPRLITDFLDYNGGNLDPDRGRVTLNHWVSDLMLDFEVEILKPEGELVLELTAGVDSCRAIFDLSSGTCTVKVVRHAGNAQTIVAESKKDTKLNGAGKYRLRFANFDNRLTLWVDSKLIFDDGLDYTGPDRPDRGPRLADLSPAGIGVKKGSVKVRHLQLWRDIYYTRETSPDVHVHLDSLSLSPDELKDLLQEGMKSLSAEEKQRPAEEQHQIAVHRAWHKKWSPYYLSRKVGEEYIGEMREPQPYPIVDPIWHPDDKLGPDEYFALGDNSTSSSDSRDWGPVPEYLILGKAVFVYWPLNRFGLIR